MNGHRLHAVFVLALLVLAGYFVWEWRYVGVQQLVVRLAPPALSGTPVRVSGDRLEEILAHNILDRERGRIENTNALQREIFADKSWRLVATAVQQQYAPVASILLVNGQVKSVREGDLLPDGAYLAQVMEDGIVVEQAGQETYVYLFGKQ